ncbi:hypothetical protein C8R47DRAFT_1217619 [Mycena vitilis]|nr:hypothetical protein C8R47DRAFT_1225972 [Mycena vitilis]KAJ6483540.1 hypothetical protein C8R47DRAFT_1217619 [Mycena vitilis]
MSEPTPKLRLFSPGTETRTVLVVPTPTWADIPPLQNPHTLEERKAHLLLILQQHAAMAEDAYYEQLVASITPLQPLVDIDRRLQTIQESERHSRQTAERHQRRRDKIDAERRIAPPLVPGIRILPVHGERIQRDSALRDDDLYLDRVRPTLIQNPRLMHTCDICLEMKSHPVLYACSHSHCFVCIRLWLETSWVCPSLGCGQQMTARPTAHDDERDSIAGDWPGWDNSKVTYSWAGLRFPRAAGSSYVTLRSN